MGRVIHFEISGKNPNKLAQFYSDAVGWKIEKWDGPTDYWLISTGDPEQEGIDGGMGKLDKSADNPLSFTLNVEDCQEAVDRVLENGGELVSPRHAVPGVGWMAYCSDLEGNVFGMMQSDPQAE